MLLLWVSAQGYSSVVPAGTLFVFEPTTSNLRLDRLHDPESAFFLRFKIEPWWNALLGGPLQRAWTQFGEGDSLEGFKDLVDPRALAIARLLIHPGVSHGAYAAWAPASLGGVPRPMWMLGLGSDFAGETERLLDRFIEWSELEGDPVESRTYSGLSILSVGGVHLVAASRRIVFSSHLSLMQMFLRRQPQEDPVPDWPEGDAEGFWRPPGPIPDRGPAPTLFTDILGALGISEVHFACRTLSPGIELRLSAQGVETPSIPPFEALPPDFDLLREIPRGSDLLLLGGGIPISASMDNAFGGDWRQIMKGLERPFALGIDVPSASSERNPRLQIGGMIRNPQEGTTTRDTGMDNGGGIAASPGRKTTKRWGDLEIEVEETDDWLRFSNAEGSLGDDWREISLMNDEIRISPHSLVVGLLSPELLVMPFDEYFEGGSQRNTPDADLAVLWRLARPFLGALEITLGLKPGLMFEITLRSKSILSPFLLIAGLPSYAKIMDPLSIANQ